MEIVLASEFLCPENRAYVDTGDEEAAGSELDAGFYALRIGPMSTHGKPILAGR